MNVMRIFIIIALTLFIFSCSDGGESKTTGAQEVDSITADTGEELLIEEGVPTEDTTEVIEHEQEEIAEFKDVDWETYEEEMTQDYSFVILISTKSYEAALERAEEASENLGYPLNLRDLHKNEEIGLSFSREVCEEEICGGGLDYPIYIPRSDWGDSKYISIEYSNNFEGFTKGYYIVIAASGEKGNPVIEEALKDARVHYKDAYAKTCGVWMGCGC